MKTTNIILFLVLTLSFGSFAQSNPKVFTQGLFSIANNEDVRSLETAMRSIPSLNVVRLDFNTQRFFVLKNDATPITEDDVKSWFGNHANSVSCIQIGVHGQDEVKSFPFTDCQ